MHGAPTTEVTSPRQTLKQRVPALLCMQPPTTERNQNAPRPRVLDTDCDEILCWHRYKNATSYAWLQHAPVQTTAILEPHSRLRDKRWSRRWKLTRMYGSSSSSPLRNHCPRSPSAIATRYRERKACPSEDCLAYRPWRLRRPRTGQPRSSNGR